MDINKEQAAKLMLHINKDRYVAQRLADYEVIDRDTLLQRSYQLGKVAAYDEVIKLLHKAIDQTAVDRD